MSEARFRNVRDVIRKRKIRVKNNTKISSRNCCFARDGECGIMYFSKLCGKTNEKKFILSGLRDRKLEAIHDEISGIVSCKS